ncbi:zinc ABC transporter substrate-binding protein [Virgibacillus halodenitrificans]|uniref:metal ABC transporter solute-binding protein, Zn/Mn family n=1 Tax=Virgibacillus halodenitrificans TaxID=1482 RepID=UPI001FB4F204|nr:zinc ABC transporter substrate-binding protein [Virgibacillus halodenitrificans]MCJ0931996.1 zinc ABC transporter substrate-binding protein [Virgibacillus halodenitrificans]
MITIYIHIWGKEEIELKKFIGLTVLFVFFISVLSGCNSPTSGTTGSADGDAAKENKSLIKVYTTLYPLEFFTKQIGGNKVEVESILPPGADAHTFEPDSKQMVDIAKADLFIYNNKQMEGYAKSIDEALQTEHVETLEATAGIDLLSYTEEHTHEEAVHEDEHEHGKDEHLHDGNHSAEEQENKHGETADHSHQHGDEDPHVWLDPIRSIELAHHIKDKLIEIDPEAKEAFEANFTALKAKLEELDASYKKKLNSMDENEILVTHAAYGYWEDSYGLEQIAISGLSPSNEPSQKQLKKVIDIVKEHQINYLLFEQNVEPRVAKIIQKETNVRSLYIHNLSVLTESDIENNEDYFTLMQQNLETLVEALQ